MGNLDNRIANPDQLLTQDVEKFCNSVVDLYSNLSKVWHPFVQNTHFTFPMYFPAFAKFFLLFSLQPLLDIGLYIFKLTTAIGAQVRVQDIVIIYCTSMLLDILRIFWSLCTGSCIYDGLPADLRPLPDPSAQADREDDSDRTEVRRRIPIRQLSSHHKQVTCLNCIYFCTTILMHTQMFLFPSQWRDRLLQWKWKGETDNSFNLQETGEYMTVQICGCLFSKGLHQYLPINYR